MKKKFGIEKKVIKCCKCYKCGMENPNTSKYCRECGYELPKQQEKEIVTAEEAKIEFSNSKSSNFGPYIAFILIYLITFIIIPIPFWNKIPVGYELAGLGILLEFLIVDFVILTTALIICMIFVKRMVFVKKTLKYSLITFITSVIITIVMNFYICRDFILNCIK